MTFFMRTVVVVLAAFLTSGLAASVVVPALAARLRAATAADRARRLARLRLLPAAAGAAAGLAVLAAFLSFEPRWSEERVGWSLLILALAGAIVLVSAGWRSIRAIAQTRRLARRWSASAESIALTGISVPAVAIDSAFPVVAVVGLWRPKLIVARSVLSACTPDELAAILAHEQGHVDRRDNLGRLVMSAMPDVLAWMPVSARLHTAWRDAAEEAADDHATASGQEGRLSLASGLLKVARLACVSPASGVMPASAFYDGQNLDRRVRRLVSPVVAEFGKRPRWPALLLAASTVAIAMSLIQPGVHALIEIAIRVLP
jgi:beta-lactamase regulating signal transducer with metallopeptidase domain